jgi:hypothetical protein
MPSSAFVSYSHADSELVEPLVTFLRAFVGSVFLDKTSIRPGTKWRDEIENAVRGSDLIALFWCIHSLQSEDVKWEYTLALSEAKNIMPILLDSTPLPDVLSPFQWVDLRPMASLAHQEMQQNPHSPAIWITPDAWGPEAPWDIRRWMAARLEREFLTLGFPPRVPDGL